MANQKKRKFDQTEKNGLLANLDKSIEELQEKEKTAGTDEDIKAQLKEKLEEKAKVEAMDVDVAENAESKDLPGSQSGTKNTSTRSNKSERSDSLFLSDDDDQPIFSPFQASRNEAGIPRKTVGFVRGTNGRHSYIIEYGPQNSRIHRIRRSPAETDFELTDEYNVKLWKQQFGEAKSTSAEWLYNASHVEGIDSIAWDGDLTEESLDAIDPNEDVRQAFGGKGKFPVSYARVIWRIEGQKRITWETRTTIRRLWTRTIADNEIFACAEHYQERYVNWIAGKRRPDRKSPTPWEGIAGREKTPQRQRSTTPRRVKFEDIDSEDEESEDSDDENSLDVNAKLLEQFQQFLIQSKKGTENDKKKTKKPKRKTRKHKSS